jgi:hypothetical protein
MRTTTVMPAVTIAAAAVMVAPATARCFQSTSSLAPANNSCRRADMAGRGGLWRETLDWRQASTGLTPLQELPYFPHAHI